MKKIWNTFVSPDSCVLFAYPYRFFFRKYEKQLLCGKFNYKNLFEIGHQWNKILFFSIETMSFFKIVSWGLECHLIGLISNSLDEFKDFGF